MFQLVTVTIVILLMGLLSAWALFYGGQAFWSSSKTINVTTLVNSGNQISAAVALYQTHNGGLYPAQLDDLLGEYLSAPPSPAKITGASAWELSDYSTFRAARIKINDASVPINCAEAEKIALASLSTARFGCVGEYFIFKF